MKGVAPVTAMLDSVEARMHEELQAQPSEALVVATALEIALISVPSPNDVIYRDWAVLIGLRGSDRPGYCSIGNVRPASADRLIGLDLREALRLAEVEWRIALIDAGMGLNAYGGDPIALEGGPAVQASARAKVLADAALDPSTPPSDVRVHCVGAVGSILNEFVNRGTRVTASDMDRTLIGTELGGVTVEPAKVNAERIAEADVALVTGMALFTSTLDELLVECDRGSTRLVLWCQTAANCARAFVDAGAAVVVAERFPNYFVPGPTLLEVYRNDPKEVRSI